MTETILTQPIYITQEKRKYGQDKLDKIISEAVDESLASLGDSVKKDIYLKLQNDYHIEKQQIPSKIDEFTMAIEEIFGAGAKLIEMKIIETLHTKMQGFLYVSKTKDLMFKDYMQSIRRFSADSAMC